MLRIRQQNVKTHEKMPKLKKMSPLKLNEIFKTQLLGKPSHLVGCRKNSNPGLKRNMSPTLTTRPLEVGTVSSCFTHECWQRTSQVLLSRCKLLFYGELLCQKKNVGKKIQEQYWWNNNDDEWLLLSAGEWHITRGSCWDYMPERQFQFSLLIQYQFSFVQEIISGSSSSSVLCLISKYFGVCGLRATHI